MSITEATLSPTIFEHTKSWLKEKYGLVLYMRYIVWLKENNFEGLCNIFEAQKELDPGQFNSQVYQQLSKTIIEYFGKGDPEVFKEAAGYVAAADLNSFLKLIIKVNFPLFIVRRWPKAWRFYFNRGEIQILNIKDKMVEIAKVGGDAYGLTACLAIQGWAKKSLELSGVEKVKITHEECKFENYSRCVFKLWWE